MSNRTKGIILSLCTAACICLIVFGFVPSILEAPSIYEGQIAFSTEQEYHNFKDDVKTRAAEGELKLNNFSVLSSELPIIVAFSVEVPYDYDFPYGETHTHNFDPYVLVVAVMASAGVLILIPASFMWRIRRNKD